MIQPDVAAIIAVSVGGVFAFLFKTIMAQGARITVLETRQTDLLPVIRELCGEIKALHLEIAALRGAVSEGKYTPPPKGGT